MNQSDLLPQVSIENLYNTILSLHYERNPVTSPVNLVMAGNYIQAEFQRLGFEIIDSSFQLPGDNSRYKNIEAVYNPGKSKELLITSHFDHIINSPGADDNLSGVSAMLEVARVVANSDIDKTIRFISFNLEEGNPFITKNLIEKGKQLGLLNEHGLPSNYHFADSLMTITNAITQNRSLNKSDDEIYNEALNTIKGDLTSSEVEYFDFRRDFLRESRSSTQVLYYGLNGSSNWVNQHIESLSKIAGLINLETCGYAISERNSQSLPTALSNYQFPNYKADDLTIGNFISIIGDSYSQLLGKAYFESTMSKDVDLQSALLSMPFDFKQIKQYAWDLTRSDHAPFWEKNIPALMITDTANFRNPYYHTSGDVISTINFPFLEKVTKATLNTILQFQV